ncbi:MAG: Clp protease N-terminal domain-containing protein, partial [Nitratireductor sp.]
MNIEKYSDRVKGFIQSAQTMAVGLEHQQFSPEHILKVLLDDSEGMAAALMQAAGANPKDALMSVKLELDKMPKISGSNGQLYMSTPLTRVLTTAEQAAEKAGDSYVTVERLLLALAIEKTAKTSKILKNAGLTPTALNTAINEIRKGRTADSANAEAGFDALKKYARDLTQDARDGRLDPVIGRDEEIR